MSKIPEGATHTYTVRGKKSYRRMAGDLWEAYIDGEWFWVMRPHELDYVKIQAATEWAPSTGSIVHCGTHNRDVEILKEPELVPYVSAACRALDNSELFWGGQFSPIKTAQQVAEEKRISDINMMVMDIKDHQGGRHGVSHLAQLQIQEEACFDLYKAGWRKQVTE